MCWCLWYLLRDLCVLVFVVLIEGLVCAGVLWYLLRDLCVLVFCGT